VKVRTWLSLLALLSVVAVARAGEAAAPEYKPPASSLMFSYLRVRRAMFQQAGTHLLVVKLLSPESTKGLSGNKTLKLRAVADLSSDEKDFKPIDISVQVSLHATLPLTPEHDKPYYLASMNATLGSPKRWVVHRAFRLRTAGGGRTPKKYYFIPLDAPDGPLVKMVRTLVLEQTPSGEPVKGFERMLEYVAHDSAKIRNFAATYASVNGWGYSATKGQEAQPDALARAVLAARDARTRGLLAGAYRAAKADLLPRDPALLKKILHHADPNVFTPALQYNLRHTAKRSADLAGPLRGILAGPRARAGSLLAAMLGMVNWGETALVLRAELEALARGKQLPAATREERVVALRVLLAAKAPAAAELILATLIEAPSAVALEYAVDNKLYAVAPAVIRAGRSDKLKITPTHLAALSLLTRRFPDGDFDDLNAWWTKIERDGRTKEMIDAGFGNPSESAEARKLIAKLASTKYAERQAARRQLSKMGVLALPALEVATKHRDPAVALAAAQLVAEAEATFKKCRTALATAANKERGGTGPLSPSP